MRDVHASWIVGEMGTWRADRKPGDRRIVARIRCCRRCEPPLSFYGPMLDLEEEMELRPVVFLRSAEYSSPGVPWPSRCFQASLNWQKADTNQCIFV